MEFGLDDTQRLFERALRDFLGSTCRWRRSGRLARQGNGFEEPLWRGLVELGVVGVLVPDRHGGAGLGRFAAGLAAEALGGFAAPVPFAGAAVDGAAGAPPRLQRGSARRGTASSGSARTASSWAARSAAAGRWPPCRAGARGEVISYAPGR